jgi:hypothetical protein
MTSSSQSETSGKKGKKKQDERAQKESHGNFGKLVSKMIFFPFHHVLSIRNE